MWEKKKTNPRKIEAKEFGTEKLGNEMCLTSSRGCSLLQVCLLLSGKRWNEPSCIMHLHVTERWGLSKITKERPHYPGSLSLSIEIQLHKRLHCTVVISSRDGKKWTGRVRSWRKVWAKIRNELIRNLLTILLDDFVKLLVAGTIFNMQNNLYALYLIFNVTC